MGEGGAGDSQAGGNGPKQVGYWFVPYNGDRCGQAMAVVLGVSECSLIDRAQRTHRAGGWHRV